MKKGFTLIEVIFVIIVLGIVASVGSEVLVNTAETYLLQKSKHSSSQKVELALEQVANRLLFRVDLSLRGKKSDGTALPLSDITLLTPNREDYTDLEWIGYDNDSFSSSNPPGWSGFVDLDSAVTGFSSFKSTGSNFAFANTVMGAKTGGTDNGAIIFLDTPYYRNNGAGIAYTTNCLYQTSGCIFPVTLSGDTATFTGGGDRVSGEMIYSEYYHLVSSAYTVKAVKNGDKTKKGDDLFDLVLYSNYQPWLGETDGSADVSLLAKNVSVFRFVQENATIRLKLCITENIHKKDITTCREKAVIR